MLLVKERRNYLCSITLNRSKVSDIKAKKYINKPARAPAIKRRQKVHKPSETTLVVFMSLVSQNALGFVDPIEVGTDGFSWSVIAFILGLVCPQCFIHLIPVADRNGLTLVHEAKKKKKKSNIQKQFVCLRVGECV